MRPILPVLESHVRPGLAGVGWTCTCRCPLRRCRESPTPHPFRPKRCSGSEGATASAPIAATGCLSKIGFHYLRRPSTSKRRPTLRPRSRCSGRRDSAIAATRLPVFGPTKRNRSWPSSSESGRCAVVRVELTVRTKARQNNMAARVEERAFTLRFWEASISVRFGFIRGLSQDAFNGFGRLGSVVAWH